MWTVCDSEPVIALIVSASSTIEIWLLAPTLKISPLVRLRSVIRSTRAPIVSSTWQKQRVCPPSP
jgi:hypothetical protein